MWSDPQDCRGERNGWCNGRHNCQRCIRQLNAINREAMRRGGYDEDLILRQLGPVTPEEAAVPRQAVIDYFNQDFDALFKQAYDRTMEKIRARKETL